MGHSRKEEIARLKRDRKAAKAAKKRQESNKDRHVRFLIVCEGKKTEPHYFESLVRNYTSAVREVTVNGEGKATVALVNETVKIKDELEYRNAMRFDRVWVVFDKDDFTDFNEAIHLAHKLGFHCAWSNESFELWYLLHFEYVDTAISREDYIVKLRDAIRKEKGDDTYWYEKGDPNNYYIIREYGREDLAKKSAIKLRKQFSGTDYASHNPCTLVDKLVEELENPESLLKE